MTKMQENLLCAYNKGYRIIDGRISYKGKYHSGAIDSQGYLRFSIRVTNGNRSIVMVHRLVAYQKFGDQIFNVGIEVRHLDGNKLNNLESNILLGSHSENMQDIPISIRKNTAIFASRHIIKYNHEDVINYYSVVKSYKKVMKKFSISSKGTLSFILNKSIVKNTLIAS